MADSVPAQTDTSTDITEGLLARFGASVEKDPRERYEGIIVQPEKLIEVATAIRDVLHCDLLSSASYVDYLADGYFEMVYHAYNTHRGGKPVTFKARTPRDVATLPSLTSVWASADF